MKSLDEFNVQELDSTEAKKANGGIIMMLALQAVGCGALYGAFMKGYNDGLAR